MVVPFPAGGLTDVPARVAASMMQEKIGQNIVVENKTGGSGTIGAAYAARAAPDGYTLFANSLADAQNLHYMPVTYSPVDDFAQIGWIVDGPPLVLIINAKLPYKTLAELIADAKANPNKYSFGTSGPASSPAMALAQLNARRQDRDRRRCLIAARAMRRAPLPAARSRARSRSSRRPSRWPTTARCAPLAVAGSEADRRPGPTFRPSQELGFKIDFRGFVGLAAPAKTPKPIVAYPQQAAQRGGADPTRSRSAMAALGMAPPPAADNTPEKFDAFMRDEIARQGEYARSCRGRSSPDAAAK